MQEELFATLSKELSTLESVSAAKLFGKPCLNLGTKAFVVFFQGEVALKLGREEAKFYLSKYEGSRLFDPSGKGRAMKDWVQIPAAYYEDWRSLSLKAMNYVQA